MHKRKRRVRSRREPLVFEELEPRVLLSADVDTLLTGGAVADALHRDASPQFEHHLLDDLHCRETDTPSVPQGLIWTCGRNM